MEATFVVIGGGIAGVSCAETLAFLEPDQNIILISESSLIKTVTNLQAVTRTLTKFDVEEKDARCLTESHSNISAIHDSLLQICSSDNVITTKSGKTIKYKYLCICTGAQPNIIPQAVDNDYVLGIRDTDSVDLFVQKLSKSRKVVIVGNGGIASEIVYKIRNTEVHWVIKDNHITATFVDPGAAEFFQHSLRHSTNSDEPTPSKRMRYKEDGQRKSGAALGPDWYKNLEIHGANPESVPGNIKIHYKAEIANVIKCDEGSEYAVEVHLTNDEKIQCDLIVSATGVVPHKKFIAVDDELTTANDGGILINEYMQTSIKNIYAAGDICAPNWSFAKHWFPMKLWTQARQMGCYVAKCMSSALNNEEVLQDFCFELFAHSTKLFGYKVILLGLYNGQKIGQDYEILLRMTKGLEYIKFVLQNNKLQGAILIGETDLEETCENLILNQIDLSPYGDDILNPDIDIEDYFD
ncbi:hypothetical protein ILUMI_25050 [Ignelater luminosus]|uniref:Pyridine nucleotide-disulfide oxidoreductase domain-containing protein 1 n=1 Tax=Ignelater luminosus TaxID=2038154 RepID=A0A8K0C644_IGNLU|nr:hypothetical protein ILUMI_25050 [Ignelater luminosus]